MKWDLLGTLQYSRTMKRWVRGTISARKALLLLSYGLVFSIVVAADTIVMPSLIDVSRDSFILSRIQPNPLGEKKDARAIFVANEQPIITAKIDDNSSLTDDTSAREQGGPWMRNTP